jgi:uncharacterized membrane protein
VVSVGPSFAEVRPLVDKYCTPCHGLSKTDSPTSVLFINDQPCDEDRPNCYAEDLYAVGALPVYLRVWEQQIMPPKSAIELVGVPQPTQAERKLITDWFLAGGQP